MFKIKFTLLMNILLLQNIILINSLKLILKGSLIKLIIYNFCFLYVLFSLKKTFI